MSNRLVNRAWGDASSTPPPGRALLISCTADCLEHGCLERHLRLDQVQHLHTPANLIPPCGSGSSEIEAALAYALDTGGAQQIIVCGHEGCAKLAAAFDPQKMLTDLALAVWLEHAEVAARVAAQPALQECPQRAAEMNVAQQLVHLRTYPLVAARLAAGQLQLLGWMYHAHTDLITIADTGGRRRAALDPVHNFLFRRERILDHKTTPPATPDPRATYLA